MSMSKQGYEIASASINAKEVENFSLLADQWWDPKGKLVVLHKFNPVRLQYILDIIYNKLQCDKTAIKPLEGLNILDIGCGGGLLCEPLARLGAKVVGLDASRRNIEVAKIHAKKSNISIDYRAASLESLALTNEKFDIVLNMEVIEHAENPKDFILNATKTLSPEGILFVATLNRTFRAWALAIIGAEYILRWLPKGTHNFRKFIKPSELKKYFFGSDFTFIGETGIIYNPIFDKWQLSKDMDINYILVAQRNSA